MSLSRAVTLLKYNQKKRARRLEESIDDSYERRSGERMRRRRAVIQDLTVDVVEHNIGSMTEICSFCAAHFLAEEKNSSGKYNKCCHDGKVPSMWLYERMMQKPYKEVINYTQTLDKFVQSCAYISTGANDRPIDCDLSNFKQMIVGSTLISANSICWTINTVIGKPDIMPLTVPSYGNLVLNLTIDETEFPFFLHPPLAKISIHNPNQIINPFFSGSTMFLNSRNKFILKKVVKNLLPPPYKTQCVDYLKRWKENGGIGATNNKECMDECKIRLSLKRFGCVIDELSQIPNQELPCSVVGLLVKQTFNKTDELEAAECIKQNCGSACYEEYYEISQKVTESHNTNKCLEKHYERQKNNNIKLRNIITVEIDLNGMETRTYTYRPKFESIEIFSNLGGYIGLWLGISLIALFDFLEMIFLVIMYPCQKLMEKRK
ncbi:amiloride-sensitive sodium channel subunit gamma-like [Parasteatoda tepidariorum]|uniref:amiloride-sensitive sodium channel subunit gamma-like n=1 Tax=Parasteatoda tepidariorum TaxID=114398 RepID=UPI0039BD5344